MADEERSDTMNQSDEAADQLEEVSGRWLRDQLREVADPPDPSPEFMDKPPADDMSTAQLIEGLASSISSAVVEPIRGLESRREARQKKLEETIQELSTKLGEAFVELAKLRDRGTETASRVETSTAEVKTEIESVRSQANHEVEVLRAHANTEIESARTHANLEIEGIRTQSSESIESLRSKTAEDLDAVRNQTREEVESFRSETRAQLDQLGATGADLRSSFNNLAEEIGRLQEKVREQHERIDALRFRETQRAKAMSELAKASTSLKDAVAAAAAMSAANEDEAAARVS
jgi:chromosome segregation ATPase